MRRDVLIIALVVGAILVVTAGALLLTSLSPAHAEITALSTDKDLYHSHEIMKIAVMVRSSGQMDNATLMFEGIKDKNGKMRLSHEIPANLTSDQTMITYDYELPSCSKCAGLDPGDYGFNVTLQRNNVTLSQVNYTVRIEQ